MEEEDVEYQPTSVRFTDEDKRKLEKIRNYFGFVNGSETVRYCIYYTITGLKLEKIRKKR